MATKSRATSEQSIPIKMFNNTKQTKMMLIFEREQSFPMTIWSIDIPWKVIVVEPKKTVAIEYSHDIAVGVFYLEEGEFQMVGPHPAKPGSSWTFQYSNPYESDQPTLEEDLDATANPSDVYMISYSPSQYIVGHYVNIGLFKDGRPIVSKMKVRVGDYVTLKPTTELFFCCVEGPTLDMFDLQEFCKKIKNSDVIIEFSSTTNINLENFPNGVDVTVTEDELAGQITINAT